MHRVLGPFLFCCFFLEIIEFAPGMVCPCRRLTLPYIPGRVSIFFFPPRDFRSIKRHNDMCTVWVELN